MNYAMFRPFFVLIVLGMLCAVAVPGARADDTTPPATPTIAWVAPSPVSGSGTTGEAGTPVTISVAASDSDPAGVVHIAAVGPDGATIAAKDGNPATATVTWTPTADQAGSSTITFTATDAATPPNAAPPLVVTYDVEAPPPPPPPAPVVTPLTDLKISHWAFVLRNVDAHSAPDASSKVVAHISTKTGDGTSNLLLLLEQRKTASGI